ncbi:hypothetical protein RDI58_010680 [Solanum bulbocastanum]|uniref:Anthocyanin acyltransferase n=1 Tax=Solanum bulbocastanum TaxID=147425 RepID=A0AAN8TRD3_SOLBU
MALSSDDNGDRKREICTELENLRHYLRDIDAQIHEARLIGRAGMLALLITRRETLYLKREAELENELETKYRIFYRSPCTIDDRLENSLSKVLTHVYPAAGRYHKDECSILCLDQGVSCTNTKVNCKLDNFLEKAHKNLSLAALFWPHENNNVDQNNFMVSPIVTIQVTKFECGGLALSFSVSHLAIDGNIFPTRDISGLFKPIHVANREENIVVKRFVVHEAALSRLRKQCIDYRWRIDVPIDKIHCRKTKMELHNFIILIRNNVNKVIVLCAKASPDEIVSALINIFNGSVRSPEWGGNKEVDKVACSSVCKFPLQDIDLGLGKPTLVYFGLKDMEIF